VISKDGKHLSIFSFIPWLFATVSAGLIIEILTRFISEGGGWLNVTSKALQSVLAVFAIILAATAGLSVTRSGRSLVSNSAFLRLIKAGGSTKVAIITGALFLIIIGLMYSLPIFARFYHERGFQYQTEGNLSMARKSYQRALSLMPGYAQAHYNLASVYEDLQPEEAIKEYLLAIENDSNIYPAYNNLARLYILRGKDKDYDSALQLLNRAVDLSPSDERVQYSLYKNLGWANYAVKNYGQAEIYLRKAVSLRESEGAAAAHCLLAYVLSEQGKPEAVQECEDCLRFAPGEMDVEPRWVNDAKECFSKGASQ
jgi:tetratricopeptide (TPR) repeat protein